MRTKAASSSRRRQKERAKATGSRPAARPDHRVPALGRRTTMTLDDVRMEPVAYSIELTHVNASAKPSQPSKPFRTAHAHHDRRQFPVLFQAYLGTAAAWNPSCPIWPPWPPQAAGASPWFPAGPSSMPPPWPCWTPEPSVHPQSTFLKLYAWQQAGMAWQIKEAGSDVHYALTACSPSALPAAVSAWSTTCSASASRKPCPGTSAGCLACARRPVWPA